MYILIIAIKYVRTYEVYFQIGNSLYVCVWHLPMYWREKYIQSQECKIFLHFFGQWLTQAGLHADALYVCSTASTAPVFQSTATVWEHCSFLESFSSLFWPLLLLRTLSWPATLQHAKPRKEAECDCCCMWNARMCSYVYTHTCVRARERESQSLMVGAAQLQAFCHGNLKYWKWDTFMRAGRSKRPKNHGGTIWTNPFYQIIKIFLSSEQPSWW
jgi:hypothetical protein